MSVMIPGAIPQDRHDTSAGAPGAYTPNTTPPHSGEPARAEADYSSTDDGFGEGPDDGAEPENASASEIASFVGGPRMTAALQEPVTFFHQRPSLATIVEMCQ